MTLTGVLLSFACGHEVHHLAHHAFLLVVTQTREHEQLHVFGRSRFTDGVPAAFNAPPIAFHQRVLIFKSGASFLQATDFVKISGQLQQSFLARLRYSPTITSPELISSKDEGSGATNCAVTTTLSRRIAPPPSVP